MREIVPGLCVAQPQLPIFVISTNIHITCLSHHNRVMSTCSDQLNFFRLKVPDLHWPQHVLAVTMTQLTLLPKPKRINASIITQQQCVPPTACNILNFRVRFKFLVRIRVYVFFLLLVMYLNLFRST